MQHHSLPIFAIRYLFAPIDFDGSLIAKTSNLILSPHGGQVFVAADENGTNSITADTNLSPQA